ncbi:MAG TPA: class I SAM-dependent methyltransferase [Solirubrobacteraceae bacterium]|nr:class I SAM-dependent methyltransferase [Solirubrobacteraceae bacterium]
MLHLNRARAESFGSAAELYDRARPSYPPALIDHLLRDGAQRVLDVGCGTGIASALLGARGCEVLGIEVDPRMAAVAAAKGLDVEVSPFESWPDAGRRFDLVVAAQAWHWIDPERGTARAAEVLVADGRIAVFWNLGERPDHVRDALADVYARLEPSLEREPRPAERIEAAVAAFAACPLLGAAQKREFRWEESYDTTGWVERLETRSEYRTLPAKRRDRLLEAAGEAIEAIGGSFVMEHRTVLASAPRLA